MAGSAKEVAGKANTVTAAADSRTKRDDDSLVERSIRAVGERKRRRHRDSAVEDDALWSGTNKNRDVSTGPLARPFACSLTPSLVGK